MFGGVGLYAGELFFALIDDDILYLKADDTTRAAFEALRPWVDDAIGVARRAKRKPTRA